MDAIIQLLRSPEFWFANIIIQIAIGLLTNWLSSWANSKLLSGLVIANALFVAWLILADYGTGLYPSPFSAAFLGIFLALPAAFPSTTFKLFVLLALNGPAAWLAYKLATVESAPPWDSFLYAYAMWAVFVVVFVEFCLFGFYVAQPKRVHQAIER